MKKRAVALMMAAVMVAGLMTGCGSNNAASENNTILPAVEEEQKEIVQAKPEISLNDEFNKTLIEFLEEKGFGDENYMVSPTSFRAALALAVAGADGDTKSELLNAMGFESMDELNAWYKSVTESIAQFDSSLEISKKEYEDSKGFFGDDAKEPDGAFKMQNSIWKNLKFDGELSDEYIENIKENFGAVSDNVSPEEITEKVNSWINEGTNGLIPSISDDLSEVDLVLANALYLRSSWLDSFSEGATEEGDFHTLDGKTVKKDFMHQQERFKYYEDENGKFVVLPMNGGVNAVFSIGNVSDIMSKLDEASYEEVAVTLPKFETETSLSNNELVDYLKFRGAEKVFTDDADFSLMSKDVPLFISDIIQKSKIKVDEDGIEAAAVTAIMMKTTAAPIEHEIKEFTADKPFKFMILTDSESPELLFCGQVVE